MPLLCGSGMRERHCGGYILTSSGGQLPVPPALNTPFPTLPVSVLSYRKAAEKASPSFS